MIQINANMGRDDVYSLTAEGHAVAERNEDGRDLVCCAVSTIMGVLANTCARMMDVKTVYHSKNGYAHVSVCGIPEELYGEVHVRFRTVLDGLEALAEQYPQCVQVTVDY